jgi:phosphoribosyl-ATP pyrophosphohydrolase
MGTEILEEVFAVIEDRKRNPKPASYVSGLLASGDAARKVEEEARELAEAAARGDRQAIVREGTDLIFHAMVLLAAKNVKLEEVMEELKRRRR